MDKNKIQWSHFSERSNMLKPTLYELIKRMNPRNAEYSLGTILQSSGYTPFLFPHHLELNPIENKQSTVKGWVAYNITSVKSLSEEKFNSMTKEHVKKTEHGKRSAV